MKKVKKVSKALVIAAIASVLSAALLSLGLFYKLFFEGAENRKTVKIPNFVGKTADEIERDGFDIETRLIYTDKEEAGVVLFQKPSADSLRKIADGEKVKISLGVSAAEKRIALPDLYGFDSREAEVMLRRLGFEVKEKKIQTDFAESGTVLSTKPLPSSRLSADDVVTLYVSEKRRRYSSEVPSLTGMSLEEARSEIERRGFILGEISFEESDEGFSGEIISQSLPSGIFARVGSTVDVTVRQNFNFILDGNSRKG